MTQIPASKVTVAELTARLGRAPTTNEWLIANGREPSKKRGRKCRTAKRGA